MTEKSSETNYRSRRKVRNYLLQPLVQVPLGLYSILLASVFSIAIAYILYLNLIDFAEIVLTLTDAESEIRQLFATYLDQTRWWVALVIVAFLVTNIVVSIVYTHRLVGPTVAFRKHVIRLMEGRFDERVSLRKGDAFGDLAEELNRLTELLQENNGKIDPHEQKSARG